MNESASLFSAITAPLAAWGDAALGALEKRVEAFSRDMQAEKRRCVRLFVWTGVAVFAGVMTLTMGTLAVVYLFWDSARLAVLTGFALAYGALLAWALVAARAVFMRAKPFQATLAVLREDRATLAAISSTKP